MNTYEDILKKCIVNKSEGLRQLEINKKESFRQIKELEKQEERKILKIVKPIPNLVYEAIIQNRKQVNIYKVPEAEYEIEYCVAFNSNITLTGFSATLLQKLLERNFPVYPSYVDDSGEGSWGSAYIVIDINKL